MGINESLSTDKKNANLSKSRKKNNVSIQLDESIDGALEIVIYDLLGNEICKKILLKKT